MSVPEIASPADERDLDEFAALLAQSLGFPPLESMRVWMRELGEANVVVAKNGARVAGGYAIEPMGMWLGGKSVKLAGVTAVAVAVEDRSTGVGSLLMRHSLGALRDAGFPIACLYPATYPVYRRVGYEVAGTRTAFRVDLRTLDVSERQLDVRAATEPDYPAVRALYDERARRTAGNLDRSPFMWWRALTPLSPKLYAYIVEGGGGPEGYVVFAQRDGDLPWPPRFELTVRDLVALTPRAGRRIWRLLADHRSMAFHAVVAASPREPLFLLLGEEPVDVEEHRHWMLRILDVPKAIEARGYAAGVRARVQVAVTDDGIEANAGTYDLAVEGGRGSATKSPREAAVSLDVRGLAALYTGYLSAEELVSAGLASGPAEALATLSSIFAGPSPWMAEIF